MAANSREPSPIGTDPDFDDDDNEMDESKLEETMKLIDPRLRIQTGNEQSQSRPSAQNVMCTTH